MTCKGPKCDRPATAGEYCGAHAKQMSRVGELSVLRTSPGEGERLSLRMPRELLASAETAAKRLGIGVREWWRRAAREKLDRDGGS